jgi:hypothetical protein
VFRVAFGLVLACDLGRRWLELEHWYTNSGLLPNHTLLWRPPAERVFSLFFTLSSAWEARFGFVLCALVYLAFVLGYRTRVAQVLALVARVSLNSRLAVLENGGDMVMDLLCLLTLPLPLGARFSLDAVAAAKAESPPRREPIVSVAVFALLLQFAAIYFFNAIAKDGAAWRNGDAVHYALHLDKHVTWAGVWMREALSPDLLRGLTHAVLATEWLGFALLVTPVFTQQARLLAACIMPCLHLGFALGLNLGGFSPAMMSFFPLLLAAEHWDALSRRIGPRLRSLRDRVERAARFVVSRVPTPAPARESRSFRWLSEAFVVVLLLGIGSELLNDNHSVPQALRVPQPAWAKAVIEYPRILQGWRMFAPEPPRGDSMIYVEATTAAGARVDPYNEVASDQPFPAGDVVPRHMGQSQFFVMYSERIPDVHYSAYRQAFSEWLLAYPQRTRRPADCLLSYDVYFVTDRSPAPGDGRSPAPADRQRFMTYSAPADSPCRAHRVSASARAGTSG